MSEQDKKPVTVDTVEYSTSIPFVANITTGRVVKVYDGDTITVATNVINDNVSDTFYRFSVRIRGIDCPEIRTKNATEKECAKIARKAVMDTFYHKIVTLTNVSYDKYGRILADVSIGDISVSKMLLDKRLAISYDGGKKTSPTDWMKYHSGETD
tara:strand:- start:176 stop:640 length:465 start_codon:yes stop_codon:yes gene_type:complete